MYVIVRGPSEHEPPEFIWGLCCLVAIRAQVIFFSDRFQLRRQTDANARFPIFCFFIITFILWHLQPISEFLVIAAEKFPQNYGLREWPWNALLQRSPKI
jgi:hypothetical protein